MGKTSKFVIASGIFFILIGGLAFAARLPVVGGDADNWGNILNTYLLAQHNGSGEHVNLTANKIVIGAGNATGVEIADIRGNLNVSGRGNFSQLQIANNLIFTDGTNVGIGTKSPVIDAAKGIQIYTAGTGLRSGITLAGNQSSIDEIVGRFAFCDVDTTNANCRGAALDGVWESDNSIGFRLVSGAGNERIRLTGAGFFGVNISAPLKLVHIKSGSDTDILRLEDSDGTCDHNPESGSETVTCTSDERLKANIVSAPSIMPELMNITIRQYTVKSTNETRIGVIAQELRYKIPNYVVNDTGTLMVRQPDTWKIVKAVQELNNRIDRLERRINASALIP